MRLAAVSALAGVAVISASSAALAADAVTGTVTAGNLSTKVANEKVSSGEKTTIVTPLTLTTNNGGKKSKTPVYCVAFTANLGNGTYNEGPAEGSGVKHYDEISWVLNHSYPAVDADVVLNKVGATVPSSTGGFEQFDSAEFLVYVATQSAVWELSNPSKFELGHTWSSTLNVSQAQYDVILKVHDYLADLAGSTPHPKLRITPDSATGTVGTKVGPFTVHSGKAEVTLTVTGGKIVDKDGNEVTTLKNNGEFWVTSDTVGKANVHGTATFDVAAGHLFFTTVDGKKGQTVISPGTGSKKSEADVTAMFTAVPASPSPSPTSPGLPVTGANVTGAAVGGAVLLLAGIGLVLVLRRRRVKFTA
jgi:LPXTG-motif cell wall-anchored protein